MFDLPPVLLNLAVAPGIGFGSAPSGSAARGKGLPARRRESARSRSSRWPGPSAAVAAGIAVLRRCIISSVRC